MINLCNICFNINKKNIINNVSLEIRSDRTTVFMGKNGAGKTTLLKLIANIIRPTSGYIYFSNKINYYCTSFVFQNHIFLNRTIEENLLHCLSCAKNNTLNKNKKIIKNILDEFNLLKYLTYNINELSLGEKQCISLIRALITNPHILFLDEPFNNLDENYKNFSKDLLMRISKDKKIFLITHSILDASFFSDDIINIVGGRIE